MKRAEIGITGIVQGIGFRPFIYNLAQKHLIRGWVLNSEKESLSMPRVKMEILNGSFKIFLSLHLPLPRLNHSM